LIPSVLPFAWDCAAFAGEGFSEGGATTLALLGVLLTGVDCAPLGAENSNTKPASDATASIHRRTGPNKFTFSLSFI